MKRRLAVLFLISLIAPAAWAGPMAAAEPSAQTSVPSRVPQALASAALNFIGRFSPLFNNVMPDVPAPYIPDNARRRAVAPGALPASAVASIPAAAPAAASAPSARARQGNAATARGAASSALARLDQPPAIAQSFMLAARSRTLEPSLDSLLETGQPAENLGALGRKVWNQATGATEYVGDREAPLPGGAKRDGAGVSARTLQASAAAKDGATASLVPGTDGVARVRRAAASADFAALAGRIARAGRSELEDVRDASASVWRGIKRLGLSIARDSLSIFEVDAEIPSWVKVFLPEGFDPKQVQRDMRSDWRQLSRRVASAGQGWLRGGRRVPSVERAPAGRLGSRTALPRQARTRSARLEPLPTPPSFVLTKAPASWLGLSLLPLLLLALLYLPEFLP